MVHVYTPGDLIIGAGCLVTTSNRCKGLHLQVYGNCYIFGTISMTKRGANAPGQNLGLEFYNDRNLISVNSPNFNSLPNHRRIPSIGASGAPYQSGRWPSGRLIQGMTGNAGVNGQPGGGGSGAIGVMGKGKGNISIYNRPGGAATSFSGGPGSGGVVVDVRNDSYPPDNYGYTGNNSGKGGDAYTLNRGAGSGAGNPAGNTITGTKGEDGTGGLIVLVVTGFLNIASSGKIIAHGGNRAEAGGAGSGGGSITVLYGAMANLGTIEAKGGLGAIIQNGSTVVYGGDGGAGSVRTHSLRS
jgi:hypothetical protein